MPANSREEMPTANSRPICSPMPPPRSSHSALARLPLTGPDAEKRTVPISKAPKMSTMKSKARIADGTKMFLTRAAPKGVCTRKRCQIARGRRVKKSSECVEPEYKRSRTSSCSFAHASSLNTFSRGASDVSAATFPQEASRPRAPTGEANIPKPDRIVHVLAIASSLSVSAQWPPSVFAEVKGAGLLCRRSAWAWRTSTRSSSFNTKSMTSLLTFKDAPARRWA
mmetsp:Transcript_113142/g.330708  ORF Transcript_113142/g.330708 Transcript_113142/m.330708 type:complete len:225 (-) Transcript_113142:365-1039(-)